MREKEYEICMEGLEIIGFPKEDYMPLKDYESWRVAVLKYCKNTELDQINWMQKHMETDEVFVLLDGHCKLIVAGNGLEPEEFRAIEMKPHKLYNIKKGNWHNHILDQLGEVLIIENQNTTDDNSPIYHMTEADILAMKAVVTAYLELH